MLTPFMIVLLNELSKDFNQNKLYLELKIIKNFIASRISNREGKVKIVFHHLLIEAL